MTEIVFEPYKRVVVRSILEYPDYNALVEAMSVATPAGRYAGLLWANHVLFRHVAFYPTDSINKEYIEGKLLIDTLEFAKMETFKKELTSKQRGVILTVSNVSSHSLFDILTKWINDDYLRREIKRSSSRS